MHVWYWCTGGLVNIQLPMLVRKPKLRRIQHSRHTSISGTFAAGGFWIMMHHSYWVDRVLHIDESLFRHKPKVWYSCMASGLFDYQHFYYDILQNHHGRPPPRQVWVFGICDTSHTPACGVMRIVPDRSATTLLPVIQQHVRSGTIVHSDEWAAYNHVQHLPSVGQHRVVNHSLHFVDLATSVHTQHAKSYWTGLRQSLSEWRMSMRPCYPRICTSSCGGNVMEVPLPLLWQFCVGTVTK